MNYYILLYLMIIAATKLATKIAMDTYCRKISRMLSTSLATLLKQHKACLEMSYLGLPGHNKLTAGLAAAIRLRILYHILLIC